jgi:hypothetical protein
VRSGKRVSRAGGPCVLVPRELIPREWRPKVYPGKKSRRPRQNVWLPAGLLPYLLPGEGAPRVD